jgi:hypothetical protein
MDQTSNSEMTNVSTPENCEVVYEFPARIQHFGSAIAPVAKGLRSALSRRVKSSAQAFVMEDDVPVHMGIIHQALVHLEPRIETLKANVISAEDAGLELTYREAGRIEQVISEFVEGYLKLKASGADSDSESAEVRRLLLGVYRHHMSEICAWLDQMVQLISNPAAAMRNRGGLMVDNVIVSVDLNMTVPPEMVKLLELFKPPEVTVEPACIAVQVQPPIEVKRPGVMGTIGALVFGLGVVKAAYGHKHE